MGADIFLESVFKKRKKQAEKRIQKAYRKYGKPKTQEEHAVASQFVFETLRATGGYLRNGYNVNADVMFAMGLSWQETVRPMLDENCYLPITKAHELLAMIEQRPITKQTGGAQYLKDHPLFVDLRDNPPTLPGDDEPVKIQPTTALPYEQWISHMTQRRSELIEFLRRSIELNEPLRCSV